MEGDYNLVFLMRLILFFNGDRINLMERKRVEGIQLQYITLLQRYLRFIMGEREGNRKFLEGMLLISYIEELWEMEQLHRESPSHTVEGNIPSQTECSTERYM